MALQAGALVGIVRRAAALQALLPTASIPVMCARRPELIMSPAAAGRVGHAAGLEVGVAAAAAAATAAGAYTRPLFSLSRF
jgi:hypothetical protein